MRLLGEYFKLSVLVFGCSAVLFAEGNAAGQTLGPIIPLALMFGVFYFLIIRPQQKKAKQHQQFLTELKRGDMVITASGIVGIIKTLSDKLVTLEIDKDVCIKMLRTQISDSANSLKEAPKSST